jgi:hypothetical protein
VASGNLSVEKERELAQFIAGFFADPYGFVMAVFPWGEPTLSDGSFNPLHDKSGPEDWQREELEALGEHIKQNMILRDMGLDMEVYRLAIASGHGIGKSAFVSWIILFLMSTRVDTRMAITASTQFQLEDKTWPELSKWKNLMIHSHWFIWTATGLSFAAYPEEKRKNYKATAATVSETNTEAFQGLHNEGKTVAVVFDEASGVLPKIWEVSEGALTDGEAFFFAFGNPTQPEGEFADCFDKHSHMYRTRHIDSRSVSFTNKNALNDIIRKYGIDSDEARVRVLGLFPSNSAEGFFPADCIEQAMRREDAFDAGAALIMGIDGSRSGTGDKFRISYRQGRDARTLPSLEFPGMNSIEAVRVVTGEAARVKPDAIVIEGTGPTIGLIDILKEMGYPVYEVYPGAPAQRHQEFQNNRAEWMWDMREWMWEKGVLPDHTQGLNLRSELLGIRFGYQPQTQKMFIESKKDMKARGLPSPDEADSLVLTFAVRIARRDRNRHHRGQRVLSKIEADPLAF